MRNVKFRAWDKEDEVMIDWFWLSSEGYLYETPVTVYDTPHLELERNNGLTAMQYTGLKDKNDVEIYEGDIVKFDVRSHYHPEVYAWEYETKGVGIIRHEMGSYVLGGREESHILESLFGVLMNYEEIEIEVVGNIHENKELIEKVKSRNVRPF